MDFKNTFGFPTGLPVPDLQGGIFGDLGKMVLRKKP
jgi:hypothetical protein